MKLLIGSLCVAVVLPLSTSVATAKQKASSPPHAAGGTLPNPTAVAPLPMMGMSSKQTQRLDLNTARWEYLMDLPGVSYALAQKIVAGRPYWSKEELIGRKIIPDATYAKIKHKVEAKWKKLDLNSAPKEQLTTLPGIDDALGQTIIEGRPYKSKKDLIEKKIVPDAVYAKISDKVDAKKK
jgi:competence protein ComEA